jgi:hypothetical protein
MLRTLHELLVRSPASYPLIYRMRARACNETGRRSLLEADFTNTSTKNIPSKVKKTPRVFLRIGCLLWPRLLAQSKVGGMHLLETSSGIKPREFHIKNTANLLFTNTLVRRFQTIFFNLLQGI